MTTANNAYDMVVIGAGAAGLTAAQSAVRLGVKVALIEKHKTGGDCTWYGCVPSKALLASAKLAHAARNGEKLGVHVGDVTIDFAAIMERVQQTIHGIYEEETPDKLREVGIEVYIAEASFVDPHTLKLSTGETLTAKYIVIATGAEAIVPDAFKDVPHLTNYTLFDLREQPKHLIILGGGPIGTEMSQAFVRLGSRVTVIDMAERLFPTADEEASQYIMDVLREEGVEMRLGVAATGVRGTTGDITVELADGSTVQGDTLLLALGRRPHIASLNPANANLQVDSKGRLLINDRLQTSQSHIYVAGDVSGGAQFTHYAGSQGYYAARNALVPFSSKGVNPYVPWAIFTEPELAQAGMTEAQARQQHGDSVQVSRLPMVRSDRAMTEGKAEGFMKAVHLPNGKLLGMTIVGYGADELINEWVAIIEKGGNLRGGSGKTRVYPSNTSINSVMARNDLKRYLSTALPARILKAVVRLTT